MKTNSNPQYHNANDDNYDFSQEYHYLNPSISDNNPLRSYILCPYCQKPNPTDNIYCTECGKPLYGTINEKTTQVRQKSHLSTIVIVFLVIALVGVIVSTNRQNRSQPYESSTDSTTVIQNVTVPPASSPIVVNEYNTRLVDTPTHTPTPTPTHTPTPTPPKKDTYVWITNRQNQRFINIRSGPGGSYDDIGDAFLGQKFLLLGQSGNWFKICYDGYNTGYVSADYSELTSESGSDYYIYVENHGSKKLNIRTQPSFDYDWVEEMPVGARYTYLGTKNGFHNVQYYCTRHSREEVGYVSAWDSKLVYVPK